MFSVNDKSNYMNRRYQLQRAFLLNLFGGKCVKCGSTHRLEFDHIDPATKTIDVGRLFGKESIIAAIVEIATKCQILCRSCHREKTAQESVTRNRKPVSHGTIYAWMKVRCRCSVCVAAKRVWNDQRNAARGATLRGHYKKRDVVGLAVSDDGPRPSRRKKIPA